MTNSLHYLQNLGLITCFSRTLIFITMSDRTFSLRQSCPYRISYISTIQWWYSSLRWIYAERDEGNHFFFICNLLVTLEFEESPPIFAWLSLYVVTLSIPNQFSFTFFILNFLLVQFSLLCVSLVFLTVSVFLQLSQNIYTSLFICSSSVFD